MRTASGENRRLKPTINRGRACPRVDPSRPARSPPDLLRVKQSGFSKTRAFQPPMPPTPVERAGDAALRPRPFNRGIADKFVVVRGAITEANLSAAAGCCAPVAEHTATNSTQLTCLIAGSSVLVAKLPAPITPTLRVLGQQYPELLARYGATCTRWLKMDYSG